jgi:hypothetical protein
MAKQCDGRATPHASPVAEVIADVVAPRDAAIEIEAPGLRVRVPIATRAETLVAIFGVLRR